MSSEGINRAFNSLLHCLKAVTTTRKAHGSGFPGSDHSPHVINKLRDQQIIAAATIGFMLQNPARDAAFSTPGAFTILTAIFGW